MCIEGNTFPRIPEGLTFNPAELKAWTIIYLVIINFVITFFFFFNFVILDIVELIVKLEVRPISNNLITPKFNSFCK